MRRTTLLFSIILQSFDHRNLKSNTDILLSNEFWEIKDNKRRVNITWHILGRHQAYNTSSKRCYCALCLNEKLKIALHKNNNMLTDEPKYKTGADTKTSTHWCHMIAKTRAEFPFKVSKKHFT